MSSQEIELKEAEVDALTIKWPSVDGAYRYTLEYRKAAVPQAYEHVYNTLSENLKVTEIRKKNLTDEKGEGFFFRVGIILGEGESPNEFLTHAEPFKLKRRTKIVCIGNESDALTVTWPSVPNAVAYVLQYRKATRPEFETLSESLTTTQVRKKNLEDLTQQGFMFRVRAVVETSHAVVLRSSQREAAKPTRDLDWVSHDKPFRLQPPSLEIYRMDPPRVSQAGYKIANVSWDKPGPQQLPRELREAHGLRYQLQMRPNVGGVAWKTIAPSVLGLQVKKKNLKSKRHGYMFRVRAAGKLTPFSLPSEVIVLTGRSSASQHYNSNNEDPSETNYDFSEHYSEAFDDSTENDYGEELAIREVSS
mmetsp:Transcript_10431/g.28840  ORF Transcript_10431/g.28840 Transcript_10431/m.28840 type:complete len:362 (-) Transcript_10431:195-1280(-)